MSVAKAQHEIDSREFVQWMAFDIIEPGEPVRMNYHFARLMALLANVNRDAKKQRRPYQINEFLLKFTNPFAQRARKTQAQIKNIFLQWKVVWDAAEEERQRIKGKKHGDT